jgi:hypothetical protein
MAPERARNRQGSLCHLGCNTAQVTSLGRDARVAGILYIACSIRGFFRLFELTDHGLVTVSR